MDIIQNYSGFQMGINGTVSQGKKGKPYVAGPLCSALQTASILSDPKRYTQNWQHDQVCSSVQFIMMCTWNTVYNAGYLPGLDCQGQVTTGR